MRILVFPLLAATIVCAIGSPATGQVPEVVLMSSSGGIAKGSYQAGVDWTISEFLRRQRSDSFRNAVGLSDAGPHFSLGAATGASAGNINALFNAISWCTASLVDEKGLNRRTVIGPEESLYWLTWVNTGFSQMLPKNDRAGKEPAVLDRRQFEEVHLDVVLKYLRRVKPTAAKCTVPLGITLTRLAPERVPMLGTEARISVQRFATILNVTVDGQGERIDFQEPDTAVRRGSLGVLALLPDLDSRAATARDHRLGQLFQAVIASSSFPVAFAPKKICYTADGLAGDVKDTQQCGSFSDGGVFDNNPFALAVGLFELTHAAQQERVPAPPVAVVYSNPNLFRGELEEARGPSIGGKPDSRGIGAVAQLLSGAVPAGREYELQGLLRQSDRDGWLRGRNGGQLNGAAKTSLMLSSRSAPIIGEQLFSFGAFLGRAFREYDFYTGIYDGLQFVARNFLCATSRKDDAKTCTDSVLVDLVSNNRMELGSVPLTVVKWQHRAERDPLPDRDVAVTPTQPASVESGRLTLLAAIHNAILPLRSGEYERPCVRRNDPVGARICGTRLDEFLAGLSGDPEARKATYLLRKWCDDSIPAQVRDAGHCTVDDDFVELLENPRRHLHTLVERALVNLDDAENAIRETKRQPGEREYSAYTEAVFSQYRASSFRYRTGIGGSRVEINPSSARWNPKGPRHTAESVAGVVLPNYVSVVGFGQLLGRADDRYSRRLRMSAITWGWRPLLVRPNENVYVSVPLELSRFARAGATDDRKVSAAAGITVGTHQWTVPGWSSMDGGVLWGEHVHSEEARRPRGHMPIYSVSGRLFAEKIQLSARFAPERGWSLNGGFADVNGLLYWLVR